MNNQMNTKIIATTKINGAVNLETDMIELIVEINSVELLGPNVFKS